MRAGLPVVSTDEGGIPDIVEDGTTGFIVPKQDAEQLASRIEQLINDRELRSAMGIAGQKKFRENYVSGIFEEKMVGILQI
jgi:glycosyltransferase involved in cell wall biosynthesis